MPAKLLANLGRRIEAERSGREWVEAGWDSHRCWVPCSVTEPCLMQNRVEDMVSQTSEYSIQPEPCFGGVHTSRHISITPIEAALWYLVSGKPTNVGPFGRNARF